MLDIITSWSWWAGIVLGFAVHQIGYRRGRASERRYWEDLEDLRARTRQGAVQCSQSGSISSE